MQWLSDDEVATPFDEGDLGDGDGVNVGATTTGTTTGADIGSDGSFGYDD